MPLLQPRGIVVRNRERGLHARWVQAPKRLQERGPARLVLAHQARHVRLDRDFGGVEDVPEHANSLVCQLHVVPSPDKLTATKLVRFGAAASRALVDESSHVTSTFC